MPSSPAIPSSDTVSLEAFRALLARYPAVMQAVSDAKGAKPGQTSLADLDAFRYDAAPGRFAVRPSGAAETMTLDDVKTLVSWKLRHGKFRPTLMSLVASNSSNAVHTTVQEALQVYGTTKSEAATPAALRVLCRLRGIGPATASLLLAVHDPARVVFFGDEVYAWLCGNNGGGSTWSRPQKYNDREYAELCAATAALQARLGGGVQAADVEKVAYVLLAGSGVEETKGPKGAKAQTATAGSKKATAAKTPPSAAPASKRKRPLGDALAPESAAAAAAAEPGPGTEGPVRRSQRVRRQ